MTNRLVINIKNIFNYEFYVIMHIRLNIGICNVLWISTPRSFKLDIQKFYKKFTRGCACLVIACYCCWCRC